MKTSLEFLCISIQVAIVAAGQADEATPIASVHPKVASIYWTTDAAVDRLDLSHLGTSIRQQNETDEARAIAVWRYVRQTMYHYPMRNEKHEDQFDAAKLINVYGYSFCTQQAVTAAAIAQAAGLKARVIGVPGHGMYEVLYAGRWHAFCTTAGFYVRTRHPDGHIASMEDLKADSTLVMKAQEEGRACVPFLPCAGGPEFLGKSEGSRQVPYALSYRHYNAAFFAKAAKDWRDLGPPNASQYQAWVQLRDGESLRLDWGCTGNFQPPIIDERFHPPRHLCGEKDRANPFFQEIATYGRQIGRDTAYRYYGSGEHVWKPPLLNTRAFADLAYSQNITVENGTMRRRNSTMGGAIAELEMAGPYLYVTGTLTGVTQLDTRSSLRIFFQGTDSKAPWDELYAAPAGEDHFKISLQDRPLPAKPRNAKMRRAFTHYRFRIRIEFIGEASLSDLAIRATVQHNWTALPRLKAGENTVEVRSRSASMPRGVTFEIAWDEQGKTHALRRRLTSAPSRFQVTAKSTSIPHMRHVLLSREK